MRKIEAKNKSRLHNTIAGSVLAVTLLSQQSQAAARFSGGLCVSQGSWLQSALQQSDVIATALEALRSDPACSALTKALSEAPKVTGQSADDSGTTSFANTFQELRSISDYMRPDKLGSQLKGDGTAGDMTSAQFRNMVFQVVFNKSYESIREIHSSVDFSKYSQGQKDAIQNTSLRLKSFLNRSKDVVNMAMATSRGILAALPQSKSCLHNRPSTAATIFGAIAHSAAALTTGGQVNGVGEFVASLLEFNREMKYEKALSPLEQERFSASVSCLIESTSEAYCSISDAETSLDYFKDLNLSNQQKAYVDGVVKNASKDIVANPLGGLTILMRDVPVLSAWMQRVLFGIDPKLSMEADMKNQYLDSYLGFIKSVNSLQADFRDQESMYLQNSAGKDNEAKLGQVKKILESVASKMEGHGRSNGAMNFFERVFPSDDAMSFILLGQTLPSNYNSSTNGFDTIWNKWASDGSNGLSDPDALLRTLKDRTWAAIEKARKEANDFFASRMVVDPQNLLAEAMKGPGVSAFQALVNIRGYYFNLAEKLTTAAKESEKDATQENRRDQLLAQVSLLRDSVEKADRVINALRTVSKIKAGEISTDAQSQKTMNVIYEAGNMMVSRDSFFGTRMMTAVQADLSDTLWRRQEISGKQVDLFLSVGPEIISRLSGYFSTNPVLQRADVSQAKLVHIANLKASESLFAKVLFQQILDIDCKLEGGFYCKKPEYDPVYHMPLIRSFNLGLALDRKNGGKGWDSRISKWWHPATEDSDAHRNTRAKLCIQALAFESREAFTEICHGAKLVSDFSDAKDSLKLNMDFDQRLAEIQASAKSAADNRRRDTARSKGVCSLSDYLRKNHLFYMYQEYQKAD